MIGNLSFSAVRVGGRIVKAIAVGTRKVWQAIKYILFKDPEVERICAEKWGDGEHITPEQAAAVTTIGTFFQENTDITSFDEFKYFTGVTSIVNRAFTGCVSLESVVIPESVTTIGESFNYCDSLSYLYIPKNVSNIRYGNSTFSYSPITTLEINSVNIGAQWFYQMADIKTLIIGSDVESIGNASFYQCSGITTIDFDGNSNLTSIENYAFFGCTSLTSITLPDSVTSIGHSAFSDCSALSGTIRIPKGVKTLNIFCFSKCANVEYFHFGNHDSIPSLSSLSTSLTSPFADTTAKFVVPDSLYDEWISDTNWSGIKSRIITVSQYNQQQ